MRPRVYLISIAVMVALGGIVYGLDTIPFLRIADVTVTGNKLVDADEIKGALVGTVFGEPNVWSLLGDDHVLFWLATQGTKSIGEPRIASAAVKVNIETRTAEVRVRERELYGTICAEDCYAFDEGGVVFARAPRAEGQLLLTVYGNASTTVTLGEAAFGAEELRRFAEAYDAFIANDVPVKMFRLRDDALGEWEAILERGTTVYFDRLFIPDEFTDIVAALVKRPDFNTLSYIDFRVPNRIYFR